MESKTPQFDTLLDKIFSGLVPHNRICKWKGEHQYCEKEFEITKEDITFLKMLRVPPSNYCPTCRRMRRLVNMNFLQLFKVECKAPNHNESIISTFPEECPFPIFDYKYYISDEFDPFSYSRILDDDQDPLQELLKMRKEFPVPSFLNRYPSSINSDYSSGGRDLKNGYYVSGCYGVEDAWYSVMVNKSRKVMDSRIVNHSELVYNNLYTDYIYNSSFIYFSKSCVDSMFLFDCRNCNDCFGCVNLRGGKYCVFNKQFSREDYQSFLQSIYPLTVEKLNEYKDKFWSLVKSLPVNASRNLSASNVSGVLIMNSKNIFDSTDCNNNCENIRHSDGCLSHQNSMDILYSGGHSSLLYGTANVGSQSSNVKFSIYSKYATNSEFVFNCNNIDNCFMCFGLRDKSYCILNKPYLQEEYYKEVDKIKTKMLELGEYDSIGIEFSAQPYNFSLAQMTFPLKDEEILKLGGYIAKEPESNAGDIKILSVSEIPKTIEEITDDILNYAIRCEISGRPFRIIASELEFLRRIKFPLPRKHPSVRMHEHFIFAPVARKYETTCSKCKNSIFSIFDPKEKYILYCEDCYKQEVY